MSSERDHDEGLNPSQQRLEDQPQGWGQPDEGQWAWLLRFERVWASFALEVARAAEWSLLEEALRRARAIDWPGASSFANSLFYVLRMSDCQEQGVWTRLAQFLGGPSAGVNGGQPKIDGWWQCASVLEDLLRADLMQQRETEQEIRAWTGLFASPEARAIAPQLGAKKCQDIAEKLIWSGAWHPQWESIWGAPPAVTEDLAERTLRPPLGWVHPEDASQNAASPIVIEAMRRESSSLRIGAVVHRQWLVRALQLHGALWSPGTERGTQAALWPHATSKKSQNEQLAIARALAAGWLHLPEEQSAMHWALSLARDALGWGPDRQPLWRSWIRLAREWGFQANSAQSTQEWLNELGPCEQWPQVAGQQHPWGVMGWLTHEMPCPEGTLQGWALAAAGRGWKTQAVDILTGMGAALTASHARWARQFWEQAARGGQSIAGRNFIAGCVPRSVVEALAQGAPFWERLEMQEWLETASEGDPKTRRKARSL